MNAANQATQEHVGECGISVSKAPAGLPYVTCFVQRNPLPNQTSVMQAQC